MIHERDGRTDRQTPRDSIDRACIVSRGKNASQHVPSPKSLFLPHLCFPWGSHAKFCMDGKRIRCLQIVSQHVSIYLQQFPSYSNCKCKKIAVFTYCSGAAHIFVSPGDAPATMTQNVASVERKFNACQTPRSMYLSIFNSFRVIRCLNQCVSPKIANFTTFLFPLETPLGQSR